MSSTFNGHAMSEGPCRCIPMAGYIRRTKSVVEKRISPDRVRVLLAGCYPPKRETQTIGRPSTISKKEVARIVEMVGRFGVRRTADILGKSSKWLRKALYNRGYKVSELKKEAA